MCVCGCVYMTVCVCVVRTQFVRMSHVTCMNESCMNESCHICVGRVTYK